jgi:hypothetical protein
VENGRLASSLSARKRCESFNECEWPAKAAEGDRNACHRNRHPAHRGPSPAKDVQPAAGTPLQLYWVGDSDIYAARSAEEALELHIAHFGEEARKDFSLPDVSQVDEVSLDSTYRYEDGKPAPSLREIRAHITEPERTGPTSVIAVCYCTDTSGSVTLSATDIDSPSPSVFQIVSPPNAAHGSASIVGSTLTFTPVEIWNGKTSLTYRVPGQQWSLIGTGNILNHCSPRQ